jgi:hypothetical protein
VRWRLSPRELLFDCLAADDPAARLVKPLRLVLLDPVEVRRADPAHLLERCLVTQDKFGDGIEADLRGSAGVSADTRFEAATGGQIVATVFEPEVAE